MKTPLEIPGLLGWLETDSDGVALDQLKAHTGQIGEWIVAPFDEQRGIVLLFGRKLEDAEVEQLQEWLEKQRNPTDDVSVPDIDE